MSQIKSINIFTNNLISKLGNYKLLSDRLNLSSSPYGIDQDIRGSIKPKGLSPGNKR